MYLLHFEPVLPSAEYVQRLKHRESRVAYYEKIHIRLGNLRLGLVLLAVVMTWASFRGHYFSPWWMSAPVAVFGGAAVLHSRILPARHLGPRAVAFYQRGLARIEDPWA